MLGLRQGEYSDIYAIARSATGHRGQVADPLARQNCWRPVRDPQAAAVVVGDGRYPRRLLKAIDASVSRRSAQRLQSADAMLQALGRRSRLALRSAPVLRPRGDAAARYGLPPLAVGALAVAGAGFLCFATSVPPSATVTTSVEQARGGRQRRQWPSRHRSSKPLWSTTVKQPPPQQQESVAVHPPPRSPSVARRSNSKPARSLCRLPRRSPGAASGKTGGAGCSPASASGPLRHAVGARPARKQRV